MNAPQRFRFFLPEMTPRYLLRILGVIIVSLVLFSQVLVPLRIQGKSMEPTYHDGGFTFCFRLRYLFSGPKPGDVVVIRFAGPKVMLLKRVVAAAGETVEFREGILFVNGLKKEEPYVRAAAPWRLPPRTVEADKVYVVGDNRTVPMDQHHFGQVDRQRIVGGVIW